MNTSEQSSSAPSAWSVWRPYVLDIVSPFLAYAIVHAFGATGLWAMTAAGAAAAIGTVVNTIRKKGLDGIGALVLVEILASILIMVFVRDPRLMLVRPSIYTAIAAVYLGASAFVGRPLTYAGARQIATRGDPARLAAYELVWEKSADFRRTHQLVTLGFALCLAVDSILRVVIVYTASLDRAAWLSNVPHIAAMVIMIGSSALAGRRFKRLAEEQMKEAAPAPKSGDSV